jgi:hypothetical protein
VRQLGEKRTPIPVKEHQPRKKEEKEKRKNATTFHVKESCASYRPHIAIQGWKGLNRAKTSRKILEGRAGAKLFFFSHLFKPQQKKEPSVKVTALYSFTLPGCKH